MFLFKGIVIGLFVSLPIGPLGLLSIQKTINKGWKIGFFSAFGAVTSDLIYSSLAILGISFIDKFVNRHRCFISGLTGILFLIVGINILSSGIGKRKIKEEAEVERINPFLSHFFMGLSNPMTFLIFFAIFSKIGIYVHKGTLLEHMIFVIAIFAGSSTQWFVTTNLIERLKKSYKIECFIYMDVVIGMVISVIGVFSIAKGIMRF